MLSWKSIVGHEAVLQRLKGVVSAGRIPHAFLFTGPEGVGKLTVARILAAAILCSGTTTDKPCGRCDACRQMDAGVHPDFMLVGAEGASLKIDQIRAVQQAASLAPYLGLRRVAVIEQAERMTVEAANSILKLLEEPPESLVFILTANFEHRLLPTVVSRCRLFRFAPLPYELLMKALVDQGYSPGQALVGAKLGGGRMGEAVRLLAPGGLALRDKAAEIFFKLPAASPDWVWEEADSLDKLERADAAAVLARLVQVIRDAVVINEQGDEKLLFNSDLAENIRMAACAWSAGSLAAAMAEAKKAGRALDFNANVRLTFEALLLRLSDIGKGGNVHCKPL